MDNVVEKCSFTNFKTCEKDLGMHARVLWIIFIKKHKDTFKNAHSREMNLEVNSRVYVNRMESSKMHKKGELEVNSMVLCKKKLACTKSAQNKQRNLEMDSRVYAKWHIHKHKNVVGIKRVGFRVYLVQI